MQYFDNNPDLKSKPNWINFEIAERSFSLKTDYGVFSKKQVDEGSYAFLKVLLKQDIHGRILDLGCGYGTIGIVLASFYPSAKFVMADVNMRACELAHENIKQYSLENVEVTVSNCYENIDGQFDCIVINPPIRAGKKVIYEMFLKAHEYLNISGSLYIVIRKSHGAESARNYINSVFGNCELLKKDKGYYIYQAVKSYQETN